MRSIAIILLVACGVFALDDMTVPNSYTSNQILTAAQLNEDNDSTYLPYNKLLDSLDASFIRFSDFDDGDSTLDTLKVSNIRGNPNVDSLAGEIVVDSLTGGQSGGVVIDSLAVGLLNIDTLLGSTLVDTLVGRVSGGIFMDSLNVGYVDADTLDSVTVAGTLDATGAMTTTTLNTGQGANELYDMNQNVQTTDNVVFNKATLDTLVVSVYSPDTLAPSVLTMTNTADTLASGAVTYDGSGITLTLATEGAAAVDTLTTISSGAGIGTILLLRTDNSARDIFIQDGGGGNFSLAGGTGFLLDNTLDIIMLMKYDATGPGIWVEIARADNS